MVYELTKLLNTLELIETKGASTDMMSDCKKFLRQIISNISAEQTEVSNESR